MLLQRVTDIERKKNHAVWTGAPGSIDSGIQDARQNMDVTCLRGQCRSSINSEMLHSSASATDTSHILG